MKMTTIAISEQDREKAKYLAQIHKLKLYELFHFMIAFFDENRAFINPENQEEKQQKMESLLEVKMNKVLTKQINRIIGFIKKQDELILDVQRDVRQGTKQILHKVIPSDEQELSEYHPLFDDYDMVFLTLKRLLENKGIGEAEMEEEIKKELGENYLKNYKESQEKIIYKNFLM